MNARRPTYTRFTCVGTRRPFPPIRSQARSPLPSPESHPRKARLSREYTFKIPSIAHIVKALARSLARPRWKFHLKEIRACTGARALWRAPTKGPRAHPLYIHRTRARLSLTRGCFNYARGLISRGVYARALLPRIRIERNSHGLEDF